MSGAGEASEERCRRVGAREELDALLSSTLAEHVDHVGGLCRVLMA